MGVELYIIRHQDPDNEDAESDISIGEWVDLVESDDEMSWDGPAEDDDPYQMAYWIRHPEAGEANPPWFSFMLGSISTKWIDPASFGKLKAMAEKLGAWIEGPDGRLTETDFYHLENPPASRKNMSSTNTPQAVKKPFWKFW